MLMPIAPARPGNDLGAPSPAVASNHAPSCVPPTQRHARTVIESVRNNSQRPTRAGLEVGSSPSSSNVVRGGFHLGSFCLDLDRPSGVRGVVSHLEGLPCLADRSSCSLLHSTTEVSHGGGGGGWGWAAAAVPPPAFGNEPAHAPICHEYTNTGMCSRINGGQSCRYRHLNADHPDVLADKIRRGKAPPGIGVGVAASAGLMGMGVRPVRREAFGR